MCWKSVVYLITMPHLLYKDTMKQKLQLVSYYGGANLESLDLNPGLCIRTGFYTLPLR